jgi:hypothetical protein
MPISPPLSNPLSTILPSASKGKEIDNHEVAVVHKLTAGEAVVS